MHGREPALSSEQSKAAPASLDLNENCAVTLLSAAGGPSVSMVSGATVSIVQRCSAGVSSPLPAASIARTENECEPSESVRAYGDRHGWATSRSIRHSNVAVGSSDENRNVAWPARLNAAGASSFVVWGASVSIGPPPPPSGPASVRACLAGTLQPAASARRAH